MRPRFFVLVNGPHKAELSRSVKPTNNTILTNQLPKRNKFKKNTTFTNNLQDRNKTFPYWRLPFVF